MSNRACKRCGKSMSREESVVVLGRGELRLLPGLRGRRHRRRRVGRGHHRPAETPERRSAVEVKR